MYVYKKQVAGKWTLRVAAEASKDGSEVQLSGAEEALIKAGGWHFDDAGEVVAAGIHSEEVKSEAYRRIVAVFPEWKQRNLLARGMELLIAAVVSKRALTAEELAEIAAVLGVWNDTIVPIRTKSDALEAMDPIPTDFTDNSHWE